LQEEFAITPARPVKTTVRDQPGVFIRHALG